MTKVERLKFVRELTESVTASVLAKIESGRVPDSWDGHELRQLLADEFAFNVCTNVMRGQRLKEYKNTKLVHNL